MAYNVFISYSSQNVLWAEELEARLKQRGITVFRDKSRLIAGREWEDQLRTALEASQHMIVLWSAHASKSHWVLKEAGYFDVKYGSDERKHLIFIVLEDEPVAYSSLEWIYDTDIEQTYQKGIQAMTSERWDKVMNKVMESLGQDDSRKPIWRLILAMTTNEAQKLDLDYTPVYGKSLAELFQEANVTEAEIIARYSSQRKEWKPFGENKAITKFLDDMLDEINNSYSLHYRWREVDEAIVWSNDRQKVERELKQLADSLCVVVIDPISLYNEKIKTLFAMCSKFFGNRNASIIPLSSFAHPSNFLVLRKIIDWGANDFYKYYFEPPIPKVNLLAQFNANPVDRHDARRLIQYIVSEDASAANKEKPEALKP